VATKSNPAGPVRIGTAGWSLRSEHGPLFPGDGKHLHRYARIFNAAEINSSFHRPHRPATYERWAQSVPPDFRFAVKIPKDITHVRRLVDCAEPLARFLDEVCGLGDRLAVLLVQLPPSFAFDAKLARGFFTLLPKKFDGHVACEPRHKTWFADDADALLSRWRVARVAADPALSARAARPGGWDGLAYYRLHGSPKMYSSTYSDDYLASLARRLQRQRRPSWCIFDNTLGGATVNALALKKLLERSKGDRPSRPAGASRAAQTKDSQTSK
jgi:uncharacterized protein YecE (DUF72 family)